MKVLKKTLKLFFMITILITLSLVLLGTSLTFKRLFLGSRGNLRLPTRTEPSQLNVSASKFTHTISLTTAPAQNIATQPNNQPKATASKFIRTNSLATSLAQASATSPLVTREITQDTNLYASTIMSEDNLLITLPKTYYAQILSESSFTSGEECYYLKYGDLYGYATKSSFSTTTSTDQTTQCGIQITLGAGSGTYLRAKPNTYSQKLWLFPAQTDKISFLGSIRGEKPQDGNGDLWYYIEYSLGPTTTHIGYIYAERCVLSQPLVPYTKEITESQPQQPALQTSTQGNQADKQPEVTFSLDSSPALVIIISILFVVPIIFIFIMLIKKPKNKFDTTSSQFDEITPQFEDLPKANYSPQREQKPKRFATSSKLFAPYVKQNITIEASKELSDGNSNIKLLSESPPQAFSGKKFENAIYDDRNSLPPDPSQSSDNYFGRNFDEPCTEFGEEFSLSPKIKNFFSFEKPKKNLRKSQQRNQHFDKYR